MKPWRVFQWTVFVVGSAVAVPAGLAAVVVPPAMAFGPGQGYVGWPVLGLATVIMFIGVGTLVGILLAYRMLKKDRWLVMSLFLAGSVVTLPALTLVVANIVGTTLREQGEVVRRANLERNAIRDECDGESHGPTC